MDDNVVHIVMTSVGLKHEISLVNLTVFKTVTDLNVKPSNSTIKLLSDKIFYGVNMQFFLCETHSICSFETFWYKLIRQSFIFFVVQRLMNLIKLNPKRLILF